MSKFEQHIVSKRFIEVADELIRKRIVKNMSEFAEKLDYDLQSLSQIKRGKRNVTIELVSKLFQVFNGNPLYLISGSGDKIVRLDSLAVRGEGQSANKHVENKTIEALEMVISARNEVIEMYKKEVARLENELRTKV